MQNATPGPERAMPPRSNAAMRLLLTGACALLLVACASGKIGRAHV
jgi:hypothetical protein